MNKIYHIYILAVLFLNAFGRTPELQFKHITPDEGLSSSTVTSFLQDHKGFMWIGTYYGLNRYDGVEFTIYQNDLTDSTSIPHSLVFTIYEDKNKNLWIGTSRGLSKYNWGNDNFINYMTTSFSSLNELDCNVLSITKDSLNKLYLGTDIGLIVYDHERNKHKHFIHDPKNPQNFGKNKLESVYIDRKNIIWIGTNKGLEIFDPKSETFKHIFKERSLSQVSIMRITEDNKGRIWIATTNGLYRLKSKNFKEYTIKHYQHDSNDRSSLSSNNLISLFVDQQGNLWIGTENEGLNLFNEQNETFIKYRYDEYNPGSLNNESIHSIYQDDKGNLWIGTFAGGINISRRYSDAILHFQNLPGAKMSLSNNVVTAFLEDHKGRIWIGTDGGGLNLFKNELKRFVHYNSETTNLKSDAILDLIEDSEKRIWVCTWAGGLNYFNPTTKTFQSYNTENSGIQDNNILSITNDDKGNLWLGSFQMGIIYYNLDKHTFTCYNTLNSDLTHNMIHDLKIDRNGRLYIGTAYGFNIYIPEKNKFISYIHDPEDPNSISDNSIHTILIENDTSIWLGTQTGLNKFNSLTKTFKHYYKEDGLPDNRITGLALEDENTLWITTIHGVSRFNTKTEAQQIFTKEDGFQSNEFNRNSIYVTKNQNIFMGTTKGFNIVYPEKLIKNTTPPEVLITELRINNKPVLVGDEDSPLDKHISETEEITLYNTQSVISFDFAVMDFTLPEKNQYAYKLEGFDPVDSGWHYSKTKRSVTYTNLSPGEYVFRVKGANNDGIWNEEGTSLKITIMPPFWQTLWFRILAIIIIIGLILFGYLHRVNRIKRINRDLERHVEERTVQLGQMNRELESFTYSVSHDLRAPLRAMNGFSEALLEDNFNKLDNTGKDYLQRIRSASEYMGKLIDELLKLSRLTKSHLKFEKVDLSKLGESILKSLHQEDINRRAEFKIDPGLIVIADKGLMEIMLKNLFSNAWKFTSKETYTKIEFGEKIINNETVFYINDNGIGFNMNYAEKIFDAFHRQNSEFEGMGIGLAIVKRIIQRHGGRIWAESTVNAGTTFFFSLTGNKKVLKFG